MIVSMAKCPQCGAPITAKAHARHAICVFCNASLTLSAAATESAPVFEAQTVSPADVDRVKQLLLDGKRAEAIDLYATLAAVSRDEASRAIENVVVSSYFELTAHMPINLFGFGLYVGLVGAGAGLAAWGATNAGESLGYLVPLVLGALFAVYRTYVLVRHLRATFVASFGRKGKGRVLRRAVLREDKTQDATTLAVIFEVVPDDGTAPFVDQETLLCGTPAVEKLVPGHVVLVRFDGAREHVYPTRPVTVVS